MGQKVNPHGLRVGVIKDWDSRWFVKDNEFGDTLVSDYNLRKYLKKTLYAAGVSKIEIERDASRVRVHIHCAKPGIVIGKGGAEIEKLRLTCEKMLGKPTLVNIVEVRSPDVNAQLVAENIAQQLEKRISHRRAMKNAMARAMRAGAKGIKAVSYTHLDVYKRQGLTLARFSFMIIKLAWRAELRPASTAMNREIARKR